MYKIEYTFTKASDGNMAYHVSDKKENVDKNRAKLAKKCNFNIKDLVYMNQTHGDNIIVVNKKSPNLIDNCDALITKEKNLTLMVMVADCIPILFMDKNKGVIAAVHAGRNSTFLNIAQKTVLKMIKKFNYSKDDIKVIFGPSIQQCCYEVSQELENIVNYSFGKEFSKNRFIDLQGINKKQLNSIGIFNISIFNICTKCSNEDYFSYRKNPNCGRFVGIITIKN